MKVSLSLILVLFSFLSFSRASMDTAQDTEKTIYFFSGLGADSSPFVNLKLPGYRKVYISWIPALPDESLTHYAGRIKSQITAKNPYIIGLSFGGIIAVEVSKQIEVNKMVLISSVKTRDDLDRMQSFFMRMGLYKLVPASFLKHTNFLTYIYFGAHSRKDKEALKKLLYYTDIDFFRWGLKNVALWKNEEPPERAIQINGTADRIIAYRLVNPDYTIQGGGHLMVFNRADTISNIIMEYFHD